MTKLEIAGDLLSKAIVDYFRGDISVGDLAQEHAFYEAAAEDAKEGDS